MAGALFSDTPDVFGGVKRTFDALGDGVAFGQPSIHLGQTLQPSGFGVTGSYRGSGQLLTDTRR